MSHVGHLVVFSALVSVFFALLSRRADKRVGLGVTIFAAMVGGGILVGLLMSHYN